MANEIPEAKNEGAVENPAKGDGQRAGEKISGPQAEAEKGRRPSAEKADISLHASGKIAELTDALKRLQAEFENYRKRVEREKGDIVKIANANLLAGLLTIFEDFERVPMAEIRDDKLRKGMELISANFRKILEDEGVEPVPVLGRLDPRMHEALMWIEREDLPEGTIVGVLQKGYLMNGKMLRPAKVSVSKKPPEAGSKDEDAAQSAKNVEEELE